METLIPDILARWGPWGIVALLLWRCIQRQDAREQMLAETLAADAASKEKLAQAIRSALGRYPNE